MVQGYLIAEEGLIRGMVFPLVSRLTIGRGEENDISLPDPTISRHHTSVYLTDGEAIVEDMGSRNGTYVNGEQVNTAVLSSGDVIWVGDVALRFLQGDEYDGVDVKAETQEFIQSDFSQGLAGNDLSGRSRRLMETISKVPFLSDFPAEQLAEVSQAANLRLVKQGKTIVQEGDLGRSMYIVLEGRVEVLTHDKDGNKIHVSYLAENQFFGEISFLTAAPRFATVRAVEDTFICELSYESMREVVRRSPAVKRALDECYRGRLRELQAKQGSAGEDR